MERIRFKTLASIAVVVLFLISIPLIAFAAPVQWVTQQYTVTAWAAECCPEDGSGEYSSASEPPLPISAYAYFRGGYPGGLFIYEPAEAVSEITSSSMYAEVNPSPHTHSYALTSFSGTYTASDTFLIFLYSYAQTGSIFDHEITVTDLTAGNTLSSHNFSGSNMLYIPTPLGHDIKVDFGIDVGVSTGSIPRSGNLTYSMSVAPEPISSILFVTGGAILAGRRFFRRTAKAV